MLVKGATGKKDVEVEGINTMPADVMVPKVAARASASMVLAA